MANDTSNLGISGSYLGEYYMTIKMGPYDRPKPFVSSKFETSTLIYLPLPSELRDDIGVDYSNLPLNTVGDAFNGNIGSGAAAAALRNSGNMVTGAASKLVNAGVGFLAGNALGSGFGDKAGEAAGSATADLFPAEQVTSAIQQSLGVAPNPNPSIMFNGPTLREFTFSWTLYARSPEESAKIRVLINTLKRRALPENSITGSAAILKYPYMCQVNFYPWDKSSSSSVTSPWGWSERSIIKMKKCVMASVNSNYNPSNVPAFFQGTKEPVATQLTINFKEIEYMLSNDYGGSAGGAEEEVLKSIGARGTTVLNEVLEQPTNVTDPPAPGDIAPT